MGKSKALLKPISDKILIIREQKVLLDRDLAEMYGVETKRLKEAVKRNRERFPEDFMFELTKDEYSILKSQIATSSWGGPRYKPMAFTEQGVAMGSSVLRSKRAIEVNILIMRAFVKMRELMLSHKKLAEKIEAMEKKYDKQFQVVFDAIKTLMTEDEKPKKKIGF